MGLPVSVAIGTTTDPRHLSALHDLGLTLEADLEPAELFDAFREAASRVRPHDEMRLLVFTPCTHDILVFLAPDDAAVRMHLPAAAWRTASEGHFDEVQPDGRRRTGIRAAVRIGKERVGMVALLSAPDDGYASTDLVWLHLAADRLAASLMRQQLAPAACDAAFARRWAVNLDVSEQLLRLLSDVLDVREVFPRVSEIVQRVLPHDRMTMTFYDDQSFVMHAASNDDGPSSMRSTGVDLAKMHDGYVKVIDDLTENVPNVTFDPPNYRRQLLAAGYRALLSVGLTAREQRFGLQFWSKTHGAFRAAHVPIARRIAVHVALAVSHEQLARAAEQAANAQARAEGLEARVQLLSEELDSHRGYGRVVGRSAAWKNVLRAATQVASTETTVLLTGESGTGKEVIARFIHRASGRRNGPFIAVNCAALPEQLLESELFGHERGAFTGAQQAKPGQIELAAGGVLFLDEVGEMSPSAQAKFLRVLQEREFQRLGGTRLLKANVRVIAATNRELVAAMERGDFREDLYYRLQVFDIRLPPLRERPEDVLPLSDAFLDDIGRAFGRPPAGMTREAQQALLAHGWRGNVRELRNVLERAAIVCEGGLIAPEHLSLSVDTRPLPMATTNVKTIERHLIEQVLGECKGNKSRAAARLGLTRKQLYVRLRQYGLA